ncbi:MAG: response regulator transcription factor [Candidatus Nanopelagicales bacterium]|jgi:DNA-binding NarL/FixJ family response regulator|nr:response regulator transcription factor [Candidatus Nanopelagicales bacterium]
MTGEAGGAGATIRVLVVDDHEVVRAGLRMLLGRAPGIAVVGEASDGAGAVEAVALTGPDVVLMDLSMPGMDGVEATARLTAEHPEVRVVVLTTFADRDHVTAAIDAGAVGFMLKDADPGALAGAVRSAARGEAPLDPRAALALIDRRRDPADLTGVARGASGAQPTSGGDPSLTAREWEVLALIGQGLSNRLVARRLGIAEKTVKAHLTSIFGQIGATDRVQAALWWSARHGGGS